LPFLGEKMKFASISYHTKKSDNFKMSPFVFHRRRKNKSE